MRPVEPTKRRACRKIQRAFGERNHFARIGHALFAGAGIGVAGIHDDDLRDVPFFTRSTQTFTGAAQTWLVVNIPATVAGVSETMSARSRFWPLFEPLPVPSFLMSQNTPLARKPLGATMEP